jgi:hypothetical protein
MYTIVGMYKKQHVVYLLLVVFLLGLFVYILQSRNRSYYIEYFGPESAKDPAKEPVLEAIGKVYANYIAMETELKEKQTLETPYKNVPVSTITKNAKQTLFDIKEKYLEHEYVYNDVKTNLAPLIKQFNEIVQAKNVNLRNMLLEKLLPELSTQKTSLQSPIYKSVNEYSSEKL